MDNADSSPAITFPNVPDDFCPTGNWQNVFQVFIDEVLSNGTILVPGLGDVTPAQITTINSQLQAQQNEIDALDTRVDTLEAVKVVTVRTGVVSITTADTSYTVSMSALPSTNYGVVLTPRGNATTADAGKYILDDTGQTTTGFVIIVRGNPSAITSIRWTAIHTE
jgi:hypothetical protein